MTALTTTRTIDRDQRAHGTDLNEFAQLLQAQRANTEDLVVPASKLSMEEGALHIRTNGEPVLTLDGVTVPTVVNRYTPTRMADEGFATRLNIPREYLGRLHRGGVVARKGIAPNVALYDATVNLSLEHTPGDPKYLVRVLKGDLSEYGTEGYVRAILSERYRIIDNLDVLLSTLDGIRQAGIDPLGLKLECELTERRMYVRVHAPQVAVQAQELLRGYRSPYGDRLTGDQLPMIYAGFTVTNSETGHGAAAITPQTVVEICRNGQTWKSDAMSEVHLGARMDEGVVQWSDETQRALLELIRNQAKDAVKTFLSREYVQRKVDEMTEKARVGIARAASEDAVTLVRRECAFTDAQARDILTDFLSGGQSTVGGMVQAVTSAAQRTPDADAQFAMEGATEKVLALAPKLARL